MNVLIVESPSKAKSINKYLGSSFKVLASIGHVRDLSPKNDAIDTENNFRIVNRINIGEAIQERKGVIFPRNEVILFCNLTTAEEMLKLEPDFISFCPYKITISERLGRSDLEEKIMISTRLLPTDTESTDINNLSVNMNEILRKIVEYAVLEDPFVINLDK